jgi:pimeloyl-ACP methyl ester carboxylesterase
MTDRVAVLGIRHHGPGSARSVAAELDRLRPSAVLIEGPADAEAVVPLAADPGMVPPVALLAYAPDAPRVSAFWPYAVFSPEWQALAWAAAHQVPARFCDLPAAMTLASRDGRRAEAVRNQSRPPEANAVRSDPVGLLAAAAGYDDPERWWDDVIESRLEGRSPPDAEALAWMTAEILRVPPVIASTILLDQTLRDYRDFLPRIDVPTLVAFGEDDKLTSPRAGAYIAERIPGARLRTFAESSHCPFWEESEAFNEMIAGFAAALPRPSG